jgi:hypothetical protein
MRIFAIVVGQGNIKDDKFEILNTDFIPDPNTVIIIKQGNDLVKVGVVKVESILERVGDSADIVYNIFVKVLPESYVN